jgi:hypothetical protein
VTSGPVFHADRGTRSRISSFSRRRNHRMASGALSPWPLKPSALADPRGDGLVGPRTEEEQWRSCALPEIPGNPSGQGEAAPSLRGRPWGTAFVSSGHRFPVLIVNPHPPMEGRVATMDTILPHLAHAAEAVPTSNLHPWRSPMTGGAGTADQSVGATPARLEDSRWWSARHWETLPISARPQPIEVRARLA